MTFAPLPQPNMPQDAPAYDRPGWVPPYPQYPSGSPAVPHLSAPPAPPFAPYGFSPYHAPPVVRRTSPDATISLIAGIAAWMFVPFLGAVIAVIFGVRARRQIREARGLLDGEGMATVGLVLGGLQLVGFALIVFAGLLALVVGFGMLMGAH